MLNNVILADLNNKHTYMLDAELYEYEKYSAQQIHIEGELRQTPWERELNNPKAVERYKYDLSKLSREELNLSFGVVDNLTCHIIEENKVAYLAIKTFAYQNIDFDPPTLNWFLDKIKDYGVLIIDIRGNRGGTDYYWKEYIVPRLINEPLINTEYMLYRGGDFSERYIKFKLNQCQLKRNKIKRIKEEKLAKLPPEVRSDFKYYVKTITELAPKKPIGFKGYIFKFSYDMGLTSTGECNEEFKTKPDIKANVTKNKDFKKDKAIQKILEIED